MASVLQPAAAAAPWPNHLPSTRRSAAAPWPNHLPSTRRSAATKEQPHRVPPCMDQFQWKRSLDAAGCHKSRSLVGCTSSGGSCAKLATSSRPATAYTTNDLSRRSHCFDAAPGECIVISGYWTGPDIDYGWGNVDAVLQRVV